jgi:hypothetical protein
MPLNRPDAGPGVAVFAPTPRPRLWCQIGEPVILDQGARARALVQKSDG